VDLFLICPTVDMKDEYNMSMDDEETKESFLGALNMERGIYEDSLYCLKPIDYMKQTRSFPAFPAFPKSFTLPTFPGKCVFAMQAKSLLCGR
ncbi:MAG: hypothetical protein II677_00040, partial [Muribaculaceae bacterium]|nr:hypothetical protein [Muribaculaceae bacterium]